MDQKATEDAGYDKGLKAGLEQGKKQKQLEIAKTLKQNNVDISIIILSTGLTEEEIENL